LALFLYYQCYSLCKFTWPGLTTGEDQETKKQKQKALIEAAFKSNQRVKNDEALTENVDVNGHKSDDGVFELIRHN